MARKPLLCRVKLHKWVWEKAEDGHGFRRCRRCGTDSSGVGSGAMDGAWPIGLHPGGRP